MESKNCINRTASNCREDEDDENMEVFFALMKNFRNKLHQLQELNNNNSNNNKRKRSTSTSGGGGGWAPVFQLEDFTSEIEFKKHVPDPCNGFGNQDRKDPVQQTSPSPPNLKLTL